MSLLDNPKLREVLVYRQVEDDFIVYDPESDRTVLLNLSAAVMFELCDGTRSVPEICREVAEFFSVEEAEVVEDVTATLEELQAHGFLH